ncbi:MAG: protein kinase [Polyangiaceae bacterium]|nr:protein kinase [Polyangiaceae bacterium]
MTGDVDALVAELRYAEAAALADAGGDHARAAVLFAQADDLDALRSRLSLLDPPARRAVAARLDQRALARAAGLAWELAGDPARAEAAFTRARDHVAAAKLALARGDQDAAGARLRERLATAPDDDDARLSLASLLLDRGRAAEAAAVAREVAETSAARARADEITEAALAAADAGGVGAGRFADLTEIASSEVARVLRGRDRSTGRLVALKVLRRSGDAEARRRLEVEARALQTLLHPHVVPLLLLDVEAGVIATPWMSGGSLGDAISSGPLTAARVAEVGAAVAGALAAAHAAGIVHRDVTAANVLFDGAGAAYLSDFGAAHLRDAATTATAGLAGTLRTMAPEVRRGEPATPAGDVYSLGAVLLQALRGEQEDARAPSELGSGLGDAHDALLAAMTAPVATDRPTAAAARARLRGLAWPDRAAARAPRDDATPGQTSGDALAAATVTLPRDDATLEAARAVVAGCELGLSALLTVRSVDDDHVRVERATPAPIPEAHVDPAVADARAFLAARGVAATVAAAQRGAVVAPIALMPR